MGSAQERIDVLATRFGWKRCPTRIWDPPGYVVYQRRPNPDEELTSLNFIEIRIQFTKSGSIQIAKFLYNMNFIYELKHTDKKKRSAVLPWFYSWQRVVDEFKEKHESWYGKDKNENLEESLNSR